MSGHLTGDARKRAVDLRTTTEAEADKNAADARAVLAAEHSAEKDAAIYTQRDMARAWNEGHRTLQRLGPDECRCEAWNESECGCGLYGSNVITPNPYGSPVHPADRVCMDCEHMVGAHIEGKSCAECGCVTSPAEGREQVTPDA